MAEKNWKVQRIRLRCEGSPVKFEGTVISTTPNGKRIVVEFDGPREDETLFAYSDTRMVSSMRDRTGNLTMNTQEMETCLWWQVL